MVGNLELLYKLAMKRSFLSYCACTQMDPSSTQQTAPAIKHIMTVPEKIELTSTGAYPSPPRVAASGQRGDFRAMRVPDKIMLETAGRVEGEGESGGVSGGFLQQPRCA